MRDSRFLKNWKYVRDEIIPATISVDALNKDKIKQRTFSSETKVRVFGEQLSGIETNAIVGAGSRGAFNVNLRH